MATMTMSESGELEGQFTQRAQAGDPQAFDWLMERHLKAIYNLVRGMLPDQAEAAKDLVQETFLSAYRGLNTFRCDCRVGTWFHRIAVNKVLNYRSKRRLRTVPLEADRNGEKKLLDLEDPQAGPSQVLEEGELQELLRQTVADLPETLRVVFVLREFRQRPYEEIAQILETTPETVRVRLHRAKKELFKRLRPHLAVAKESP
jgi:RNA polymerase sigma-70 factor (ECF subfamily)